MSDTPPPPPFDSTQPRSNDEDQSFRSVANDTTIGIRFDRLNEEVQGSVVSAALAMEASPEILANETEALPTLLVEKLETAEQENISLSELELLRVELSEIAVRVSERLLQSAGRSQFGGRGFAESILAIGIHGDGIWNPDPLVPAYHQLVDASRVAERTGKTVISGFPERDVAQGGVGGPVDVHGLWWLLADRNSRSGCHWRGLVTLHPNLTRFTVIGPIDQHLKTQTFPSTEIGVGHRFLSEIADALIADALDCSPVGSGTDGSFADTELISRGKPIPELEEIWHATAPRNVDWSPSGVSPLSLIYAMKNSIYASSRLEDLLATAVKFIATQVSNHCRHQIPASRPIGELFLTGEGSQINKLQQYIRDLLPEVAVRSSSETGFDGKLYSASIAALALLHLWQIPLPSTAPGQIPRVLGSITPGSPSNWHHVLSVMNSNAPWLLPLREAI